MLCVLTAILSGSSTAIICVGILIIFINLLQNESLKIFERRNIWIGIYIAMLLIIFIEDNIFANIFFKITGKARFTGRSFLWSESLKLIRKSPIIGYGRISKGYLNVWNATYSSHNVVLEILLEGGIIALLIWISCLLNSLTLLKDIKEFKVRRVLLSTVFVILIALMMEATVHSIYLFSVMPTK